MGIMDDLKITQKLGEEISKQVEKGIDFAVNKTKQVANEKIGLLNAGGAVEQIEVYDDVRSVVSEDEIANIVSIDSLENLLTKIQNSENADEVLTHSIEAQLQVIKVLNSPEMASSPFDTMIAQLNRAVKFAANEEQKEDIQTRASIMANNIVFFMEAKLKYEEDKNSQEGRELLKQGCVLLAESSVSMAIPPLKATGVAKMVAANMFKNAVSGGSDSFLSKVIGWWGKKKDLEKSKAEFQRFVALSVDKINKYHNLFGESIILSELVERYKPILIEQKMKNLQILALKEPVGSTMKGFMFWLPLLLGFVTVGAITGLIAGNFGMGLQIAAGLWLVGLVLTFIGNFIGINNEKRLYGKAKFAYERYQKNFEGYYDKIISKIGIGGSADGIAEMSNKQLKDDKAIIDRYVSVRNDRYNNLGIIQKGKKALQKV
ncbi:MAG: hypothetical protein FWE23_06135 [Chitinivibrionia bacterium]|nr:hypothetical protein [Chitinivibrionia bacterium]